MKRKLATGAIVLLLTLFASALVFAGGAGEKGKPAGKIPKKVGWVGNYMMHEWYQTIQKGMKARAEQLGIQLEIADANLAEAIVKKAKAENIPLVIEASSVKGMTTMVAICDYDCGYKGGVETGKYVKAKLGGKARILAVDFPMLRPCILRTDGFWDGIRTILPDAVMVHRIDGQGLKDKALQAATDALTKDSNINVIYGINDDSAFGAMQAYKAAGLDMQKVVVCGTGSEGLAFLKAFQDGGPYKVEAAMFPEAVGYECINMTVKLFNKETVPEHWVTPTFALTTENWNKYFSLSGEVRTINWDAVNALSREAKCAKY
jgi:ribose transport system substrate-binding protein